MNKSYQQREPAKSQPSMTERIEKCMSARQKRYYDTLNNDEKDVFIALGTKGREAAVDYIDTEKELSGCGCLSSGYSTRKAENAERKATLDNARAHILFGTRYTNYEIREAGAEFGSTGEDHGICSIM